MRAKIIFANLALSCAQDFITGQPGPGYEASDCESSTCLSNIANCKLGDVNCVTATYKINADKSGLDISLSYSGTDSYVAIGISPDGKMPNTDIYYCQNQGNTIGVQSALSFGYAPPAITSNGIVANTVATNLTANVYTCRFTRELDVTKTGGGMTGTFNIEEGGSWNVLMAKGKMNGDQVSYHGPSSGDGNTALFSNIDLFSAPTKIETEVQKKPALLYAHAVCMFLAWCFFAPLGISSAAVLKNVANKDSKLVKGGGWFQIHRIILSLAALLGIVGFIIIFVNHKSFVKNPDNTAHGVLGIIVTAFSIINPIMGMLRPGVDAPKRKYFNFFHYLVGYSAQIMAFATLYLGMEMFGLEEWSRSLLISIAVIWFLTMVVTRFTKSVPIVGKILAVIFYLLLFAGFGAILSQLTLAR